MHYYSAQAAQIFGNKLRAVILYGSYARGDYDDESDIDIMVLSDMPREQMCEARKHSIFSQGIYKDRHISKRAIRHYRNGVRDTKCFNYDDMYIATKKEAEEEIERAKYFLEAIAPYIEAKSQK